MSIYNRETEFAPTHRIDLLSAEDLTNAPCDEDIRVEHADFEGCTTQSVLDHPKTHQVLRMYTAHIRSRDGYDGPHLTADDFLQSSERHADLLEFVERLPIRQSFYSAARVQHVARETLQRLQLISSYTRERGLEEPDEEVTKVLTAGFDDEKLEATLDC